MTEAASHAARGGPVDTRFRSTFTRSQWLRQNYRRDMTDAEKAALLEEYHRGDPVPVTEMLDEHNEEDR